MNRFLRLPLATKVIASSLAVLAVVVAVNYVVFIQKHRESASEALVAKAASFTAVADETKSHVSQLHELGGFDMPALLEDLEQQLDSGSSYSKAKIFGAIPVVAGWTAAEKAAKREGLDFRIVASEARNPENQVPQGSFRSELLADLREQVRAGGETSIHRVDEDANQLHFMRAIQLTRDCMLCHGQPGGQHDPDGDGKDVLGFVMEGWKPGDMHGAYEVIMPLSQVDEEVASFVTFGLLWTLPLIAAGVFLLVLLMRRFVGRPIKKLMAGIEHIRETNDLTADIGIDCKDELGQLSTAFCELVGTLRGILSEVVDNAENVAAAATEISVTSDGMANGMSRQTDQATRVSSAVEEMSASVVEVARRSAEAARGASEAGEYAAVGGETVSQTVEGMKRVASAVEDSSESIGHLTEQSKEIGKIVDLITDVAEQTTLLALNAGDRGGASRPAWCRLRRRGRRGASPGGSNDRSDRGDRPLDLGHAERDRASHAGHGDRHRAGPRRRPTRGGSWAVAPRDRQLDDRSRRDDPRHRFGRRSAIDRSFGYREQRRGHLAGDAANRRRLGPSRRGRRPAEREGRAAAEHGRALQDLSAATTDLALSARPGLQSGSRARSHPSRER
jgi:methyl-accepting chemotaxis protein